MALLSVEDVSVRFGGVVALRNVSLQVDEGLIWGLIGPNGAGKTTLINIISGLIRPTEGRVSFAGEMGGPWPMTQTVRRGIVRTFQQTRAFLGLTVAENLRIAAVAAGRREASKEIVDLCGLGPVLGRVAGDLPYVALRHLGIAMAMSLRPKLLLLDEPAVGLTPGEVGRIGELIRKCKSDGVTVLLVEHNVRFLMELSDRVSVLDRGQVLFEGEPAECQARPEVIEAYLGRRFARVDN
jgi:branched-chain amino acid transport system ATP-binding protein